MGFQKLFQVARGFDVNPTEDTTAWVVVEVLGWIGAMTLGNNRDTADVRIYCDNDRRWTPVPDDPVSIAAGITPNSERYFGEDEEYEDPINFMRRDTDNVGRAENLTLGVTYSTESPEGFGFSAPPANHHSPRQTITICDLAFTSRVRKFSQIPLAAWASMQMSNLILIPTFVLLHQLLGLEPYGFGVDAAVNTIREDAWSGVFDLTAVQAELLPTPYIWNAVLAYAADLGWGISPILTAAQYSAGQNLFRYSRALINVPFIRGGPITLPTWLTLPPN